MPQKHLIWFRQDLRVTDNRALSAACEDPQARVCALFFICRAQWRSHDMAPLRERFILRNLAALQQSLQALHIPLLIIDAEHFSKVPDLLRQLIAAEGFTDLFFNREYGWNERQRDREVQARARQLACRLHVCHDQGILEPGLQNAQGKAYTIFTPFKKRWLQRWGEAPGLPLPDPAARAAANLHIGSAADLGLKPAQLADYSDRLSADDPKAKQLDALWPAGEEHAMERLQRFVGSSGDENDPAFAAIFAYHQQRDIPAIAGTSVLSPWLNSGTLSPRTCLAEALALNDGRLSGGQPGIDTWISELIWRDFYLHILFSFPDVSRHRAFRANTEQIPWIDDDAQFAAWCEGRTGFPLIDAAMRQLQQTGWMHNRLRMLVAMFLSKHLLIDWRKGERFFMQHLVDGHLAANNGGWQWAASTGTDAVPYFRLFNPVTQSQRFDPQGSFIKCMLPELTPLEGKAIHLPPTLLRETECGDYPAPMIDLQFARQRALASFGAVRST